MREVWGEGARERATEQEREKAKSGLQRMPAGKCQSCLSPSLPPTHSPSLCLTIFKTKKTKLLSSLHPSLSLGLTPLSTLPLFSPPFLSLSPSIRVSNDRRARWRWPRKVCGTMSPQWLPTSPLSTPACRCSCVYVCMYMHACVRRVCVGGCTCTRALACTQHAFAARSHTSALLVFGRVNRPPTFCALRANRLSNHNARGESTTHQHGGREMVLAAELEGGGREGGDHFYYEHKRMDEWMAPVSLQHVCSTTPGNITHCHVL